MAETDPPKEVKASTKKATIKPRIKISLKIFLIPLTITSLLLSVTLFARAQINSIQEDMLLATTQLLGVERYAASINAGAKFQLYLLERAMRLYKKSNRDKYDSEIERYAEKTELIQRQFDFAILLIDKAIKKAPAKKKEFSKIKNQIININKEYEKSSTNQEKLIRIMDARGKISKKLAKSLNKSQDIIDDKLDTFKENMRTIVETANSDVEQEAGSTIELILAIASVATVLGVIIAVLIIMGITKPVKALVAGTQEVEKGKLDGVIDVTTHDEIGQLTRSFNNMVSELKVKEKIKGVFGKYVDPRIVNELIEDHNDSDFSKGQEKEMSVFFSDITNFTNMSEQLDPNSLVKMINEYLTFMSEPIKDNLGVIDKFIGDAIMAYWGEPFVPSGRHPLLASNTALLQLEALELFKEELPELIDVSKLKGTFNIRIGIATGNVTIGNIGSEDFKGFTVMGDIVNLAARLESINKVYGTNIIIDQNTYESTRAGLETREMDTIRVKGKEESVKIYELLALSECLSEEAAKWRDIFEEGLYSYREKHFAKAKNYFKQVLALKKDDAVSKLFLERIAFFDDKPEKLEQFDGVWVFDHK